MKMNKGKREVLFGVVTALSIAAAPFALSQSTGTAVVAQTATVVGACGKLFDVDSNAAGLTAQERAALIQKNLDNAIIKAHNRTPDAVAVQVVNRNPVVTLDGFHIATADGNSAARNRMSQMQLAQKWADSIKFCLADAIAIDKYLAMLTGKFATTAAAPREEEVAYAPAGMFLPIKLATPISSEASRIGETVQAVISSDIPLQTTQSGTKYEAYLPAGSVAIGEFIEAGNDYLGKNAFGVRFHEIRTPDGEVIPINAHVLGGIGTWVTVGTEPNITHCAMPNGKKETAKVGLLASKGEICGGWRGRPIQAGIDVPYQKLVFKRRTGINVAAGERMIMQLTAPTAIAVCTNCAGPSM